jgi:hypothetical protein
LKALETGEEATRLGEIEKRHGEMTAQRDRMRLYLASKTQEAARLGRQIDDVPTRSELIQYERRFVELFEQVRLCVRLCGPSWVSWSRCCCADVNVCCDGFRLRTSWMRPESTSPRTTHWTKSARTFRSRCAPSNAFVLLSVPCV